MSVFKNIMRSHIPTLNFSLAVTYFFWESSACPLSDCQSMLPKSPHEDVISDLKIKRRPVITTIHQTQDFGVENLHRTRLRIATKC